MPQTIALVDDDRNILTSVSMTLEQEGYQVRTYTDGESALQGLLAKPADLAVLDIKMPRMDGMELLQRLRQRSNMPVVFLTSKDEEVDELMGLRLGADDYITKPFSPKELMARIKAVMRRRAPQLTNDTVEIGGLRLDPATHRLWGTVDGQAVALDLGPTEFRLLHFFMTHAERVHSRAQLLDQVWGDHVFVEERTVDVHIRRLRKALEPTGHDRLIETVRGSGYRFSR
jgi:two-component system phosphate regulon response regulator PhoB